ncbi:hypothetical protein U9M48_011762 [Paspalum notatum var. saurae]|uniref:Uncharacterized protein n=1 Tax=Paspalum notatum var. saurae TaxID=547442 RepID=A0AAQ3SWH0_PASNO
MTLPRAVIASELPVPAHPLWILKQAETEQLKPFSLSSVSLTVLSFHSFHKAERANVDEESTDALRAGGTYVELLQSTGGAYVAACGGIQQRRRRHQAGLLSCIETMGRLATLVLAMASRCDALMPRPAGHRVGDGVQCRATNATEQVEVLQYSSAMPILVKTLTEAMHHRARTVTPSLKNVMDGMQ